MDPLWIGYTVRTHTTVFAPRHVSSRLLAPFHCWPNVSQASRNKCTYDRRSRLSAITPQSVPIAWLLVLRSPRSVRTAPIQAHVPQEPAMLSYSPAHPLPWSGHHPTPRRYVTQSTSMAFYIPLSSPGTKVTSIMGCMLGGHVTYTTCHTALPIRYSSSLVIRRLPPRITQIVWRSPASLYLNKRSMLAARASSVHTHCLPRGPTTGNLVLRHLF